MAYATLTYYKTTYAGASASDALITSYLARASDDIDMMAIIPIDTSSMGEEQLDLLAKATCAQAEGYIQYGESDGVAGSISLGSFSLGAGTQKRGSIFQRAYRYATMAGLLNRSIGSIPSRHAE